MPPGGGEGSGNDQSTLDQIADKQAQKNEHGKDLQDYREVVSNIHTDEGEIMQEEEIAKLLKDIDEAEKIPDLEKRRLFDQARAEINSIPENARSHMLRFMDEMKGLEKDNTDIADDATYAEVTEFANHGLMERFMRFGGDIDFSNILPPKTDQTAMQMYFSEEFTGMLDLSIFKKAAPALSLMSEQELINAFESPDAASSSSKGEEGSSTSQLMDEWEDNIDAFVSSGGEIEFELGDYPELKEAIDGFFGRGSFEEYKTFLEDMISDFGTMKNSIDYVSNFEEIDLGRTTVIDYLAKLDTEITEETYEQHEVTLLELSQDENYDRDVELEKKMEKINELGQIFDGKKASAEDTQGLSDVFDAAGDGFEDLITQFSNESPLGEMFAKLFREGGPLAFIGAMLGPDFQEAISEGNLKKQRALFNLVKLSKLSGSIVEGADFSQVGSDDLSDFFAELDDRGINYGHNNFWQSFLTGTVPDNKTPYKKAAEAHEEILKQDEDFFTFTDADFSYNNEKFLLKLKGIELKEIPNDEAENLSPEGQVEVVQSATPAVNDEDDDDQVKTGTDD